MSIRARLAKLERDKPGARGRCITMPLYEGETRDAALAAHPDIEPGKADMLIFVKKYQPAPAERARPVITPMVA